MSTTFYIALLIAVVIGMYFFIREGWEKLWNGTLIILMLIVLVLTQKYIGKIEGALITLVPVIIAQFVIRKNRRIQSIYISKKTKFINWCNKNIYEIVPKDEQAKKEKKSKRKK